MIKYVKWTFFSKDKEPAFILFQGQNIRIICFQKELPNINFVVLDMNIEQKIIYRVSLALGKMLREVQSIIPGKLEVYTLKIQKM